MYPVSCTGPVAAKEMPKVNGGVVSGELAAARGILVADCHSWGKELRLAWIVLARLSSRVHRAPRRGNATGQRIVWTGPLPGR